MTITRIIFSFNRLNREIKLAITALIEEKHRNLLYRTLRPRYIEG